MSRKDLWKQLQSYQALEKRKKPDKPDNEEVTLKRIESLIRKGKETDEQPP